MSDRAPLPAADLEVLEFERATWRGHQAKENAIRQRWGYSPTRHYQRVNYLIQQPAALAYDAQLVARLLRLQQRRRAARNHGMSHLDQPEAPASFSASETAR